MAILITGITGRVGSHLARNLLAQHRAVRGLVLPDDPARHQVPDNVEVVWGDLSDRAALAAAVRDVTHIVHLAAVILYQPHQQAQIWRVNVEGTRSLLDAIQQRPPSPLHLVFASSDQVYPGPAPQYVPTDENHPLAPNTPYGLSKLLGEEMVQFTARTVPDCTFAIVRFCHNQTWEEVTSPRGFFAGRQFFVRGRLEYLRAGRHTDPVTLQTIARLEPLVRADEPLLLPLDEDGIAHTLDIMDTRDVARNLEPVLFDPRVRNEILNFAPQAPVSMSEVVPYMGRALGRRWEVVHMPGPAPRSHLSGRKARILLGLSLRHTIFDMIDMAAERWGRHSLAQEADF